jgi:hypothetical protein
MQSFSSELVYFVNEAHALADNDSLPLLFYFTSHKKVHYTRVFLFSAVACFWHIGRAEQLAIGPAAEV